MCLDICYKNEYTDKSNLFEAKKIYPQILIREYILDDKMLRILHILFAYIWIIKHDKINIFIFIFCDLSSWKSSIPRKLFAIVQVLQRPNSLQLGTHP